MNRFGDEVAAGLSTRFRVSDVGKASSVWMLTIRLRGAALAALVDEVRRYGEL